LDIGIEALILLNVLFLSCRELSAEALLDLDIFNLSASDKKKKPTERKTETEEEEELEDNSPLFWQPGKRGFYSPRPGKSTPERLNAFRNVGRYEISINRYMLYVCNHVNSYTGNYNQSSKALLVNNVLIG
jgi:hypothetical protein